MLVPKLRFKREDGTSYPEWEEKAITDLCESIVGGGTPSTDNKAYWSGNIAWVSSSDLENNNIRHLSMTRFITEDAINNSAAKHIPCNSILIVSRVGVGKVAIAPCELCTSQDFTNLVNPVCNPIFLGYLLSLTMQKKANGVQGTSIKGVTAKEIKQYHLSIPHTEEQQRIADFLSNVDEVIAQSKAEVQNLERQKKAAMQKIFSQEVRFKREDGSNYPEWGEKVISDLGTVITGNTPPTKNKENYGGDFLWVTPTDITDYPIINDTERKLTDIGKKKARILPKNTVLVTCIASIGKNCILTQEGSCNQQINAIIPKTCINPFFLLNAINYKKHELELLGGNGGMKIVSKSLFEQFSINIPADVEEQQKIADFLSDYDEAIRCAKQELDKWKELKKGLLQQMFV